MDFFKHAHQQQNAEEEQQRFELDNPDVFQNGVQIGVVAHEARHQEHNRQAEQEGKHWRNTKQSIPGNGSDDGDQKQRSNNGINLAYFVGTSFKRDGSIQPSGQQHGQYKHGNRCRNGKSQQREYFHLVRQEDHQGCDVTGDQGNPARVNRKYNQNNKLQAFLKLKV